MDAVKNATANFYANVADPKASLLTTLNSLLDVVSEDVPLDGIQLKIQRCADYDRADFVLRCAYASGRHLRRVSSNLVPDQ